MGLLDSLMSGPKIKPIKPIKNLEPKALEVPQISAEGLDRAISGGVSATSGLTPIMFKGGGLQSALSSDGLLGVESDPGRQSLIDKLMGVFNAQAGETRSLRDRVRPGISELREARLREIENARQSSISNLRDNLARRKVLGSSFGEDALTRSELEFGQAKERVAAETFLQELDLTNQLINQEYEQRSKVFATKLNELNLHAEVAGKLLPEVTQVMQTSAQLRSQIATIEAQILAQMGISQGQITGDMRRTGAQLEMERLLGRARLDLERNLGQSELDAKAQEGFGSFLGTIATAPMTGGGSLVGNLFR